MLKKNYVKNKKFNYRYNIIGDFDYFINLSLTENFYYIKKPLAYYRIQKDNYSKNTSIDSRELNQCLMKNSKKLVAKNYSLKKNYYNNKLKLKNFLIWDHSSLVEYFVDIEGVASSILAGPTIKNCNVLTNI